METGAQRKALSNTNYGSNYDEIFENHSPELDGQMPAIDKLDIHSNSESSSETDYGDENDKFFKMMVLSIVLAIVAKAMETF